MQGLLIDIRSKYDAKFLSELIAKLGYKVRVLSEEEIEDMGLAKVIYENKTSERLSVKEAQAHYKTLKKAK